MTKNNGSLSGKNKSSDSNPSEEDLLWYFKESKYIGFHKPQVTHTEDVGFSYLERRKEEPEEDRTNIDNGF